MKAISRVAVILVVILLILTALVLFVFFPADRVHDDPGFLNSLVTIWARSLQDKHWRPMDEEASDEILFMRLEDSNWTSPQIVPFASRFFDSDDPCFSPDGEKLFFTSWRPVPWSAFWRIGKGMCGSGHGGGG